MSTLKWILCFPFHILTSVLGVLENYDSTQPVFCRAVSLAILLIGKHLILILRVSVYISNCSLGLTEIKPSRL